MKHIILFYYIFTFAFGLGSLFTFILITARTKSNLLFHILVFYLAFTLNVFHQMYYSYVSENLNFILVKYSYLHYIISICTHSLLVFSIPFFTSSIANYKYIKIQNIIITTILMVSIIIQLFINLNEKTHLTGLLIIFSIAYAITIGITHYKKIKDKDQRKLLRNVCIAAIIFFPGIIYNEFPVFKLNFYVSPLLYCSFCAIFITFIVKIYFRDYYISEKEIEYLEDDHKQNTIQNTLNRHNLSEREKEVALCIIKGYSNKKIADVLFISLSTVKSHIHNIFQKTKCSNRYELIHLIKFN